MLQLAKKTSVCILLLLLPTLAMALEVAEDLPYVLKWKRLLGAPVLSSATVVDSLVYIGSMDGHLYALRAADGTVVWKHRTDAEVCAKPALVGDLILTGGYDAYVYALDRITGAVRWEFVAQGGITTDMIVEEDVLFFGSADYKVYALRVDTGEPIWQCKTRGQVSSTPAVDEQRVYFGSDDKTFRAVSRKDGELLWEFETRGSIRTDPLLFEDKVYFGSNDRYLYALNATDGTLAWKVRIGGKIEATPVLLDDRVYLGSTNGFVYALEAATGKMVWKHDCEAKVTGSALAASDSAFFIGTEDGFLYQFNATSGKPLWAFETHSSITARPTLYNKVLYISADDGFLYVLDLAPTFPPIDNLLWENWYEQYYMDSKAGYIHEIATQTTYNGADAIHLRIEEVDWENGFRRTISERLVDTEYHLMAFEKHKFEYSQHLCVSGEVRGDSLFIEESLAGHSFARTVPMPKDAVAPELFERKLLAAHIPSIGDTFYVSVFNYATFDQVDLQYTILDTSSVDMEGRKGQYVLGQIDYLRGDMKGIATQEWIDATGQVILSETPIFHLYTQRVPRNEALTWYVQEEAHGTYSDVQIERPTKLNILEVRLELNVPGIARVFSDDERQKVIVESDTTARVIIRRLSDDEHSAGMFPFEAPELQPYLQPTVYCQSHDPRMVQLAHKIVGDETNAWRAAKKLTEWVYNNMIAVDTNVKFKSSLEVLESMEGTCSEYTVLFIALARAIGLPSRVAVGLIPAIDNVIGLHMWPEVYIGKWLGVDPSWNEMNINPAHIKITTGTLALEDMLRFDIPLQLALTQLDTVRVIRFDSEEGLRLVEADKLFEQATKAENRYQEEEAIALFKKLTSYPPNSKTDDALLNLSEIHLRQNRVEEAIETLNVIFEKYFTMKDVDRALYRLAMIRKDREHKPDLALTALQTLVAKYPESELADDALCTVGEIYEKNFNDLEAAEKTYRQVKEQYADTGWAIVAENALKRLQADETDGSSIPQNTRNTRKKHKEGS